MAKSLTSALPLGIALMAGVSLLAVSEAAKAQQATAATDAQASTNDSTTVIVTANKRKEPVQKVAQTVNVVSGQTLDDLHIQSFQEVSTAVAGLSLTRVSGGEQSISLRGIKMSAPGATGTTNTVEVYENEVPVSVTDAFTSIFDLGQIEVLRGPQGTLRGRPSPSGAITIGTRRGSFTSYDGFIEASVSDHGGQNLQAAFGGPVNDKLAFRLAGLYDANDDNQAKDIYNGKRSQHDTTGLRGTLTWKPVENFEVNLMTQYLHENLDFYREVFGTAPCAGGGIAVSSIACGQTFKLTDRISLNQGTNPNDYKGKLATLTARYGLNDHLEIDYVGGYNDSDNYSKVDFDFAGIGDANNFASYFASDNHVKTLTNEIRLQSNNNEFYNFTYGLFSSDAKTSSAVDFHPLFTGLTKSENKDFGAFTNQRFELSSQDNLSLGIRYSKSQVDSISNNTQLTYQAITGNGSYQHQFTHDIMGYVSYGTSFRPGSGNAAAAPNNAIPASFGNYGPEHSQSTEIGLKSQWFEHRLTANVALFDQKYDGYITSTFNVACTGVPGVNHPSYATTNGLANGPTCFGTMVANGNAVSKGVELELRWLVTPHWTIGGNYTYTDAHFLNALLPCDDFNNSGAPNANGTPMVQPGKYVSQCLENQSLGDLPAASASGTTDYNFHLGNYPAYVRASVSYNGKTYLPENGVSLPADTRVNAYIGIKDPKQNWEFSIWAKNLLNDVVQDHYGGAWNIYGVPSGISYGTVTPSREIGATLRRDL